MGGDLAKSPRNEVKFIEQAESTTQNCESSRPGVREEENATKLQGTITYVSSYSSVQSSRVGKPAGSSAVTSLSRAACAEAEPPRVPYFCMIIFRFARVHLRRASYGAVEEDRMWSRLPQALHLLGRPRSPREPRGGCPRLPCDPRPPATNADMGGGDVSGAVAPGASRCPCCVLGGGCWPSPHQLTTCSMCRTRR
jgi:hypothetical protein